MGCSLRTTDRRGCLRSHHVHVCWKGQFTVLLWLTASLGHFRKTVLNVIRITNLKSGINFYFLLSLLLSYGTVLFHVCIIFKLYKNIYSEKRNNLRKNSNFIALMSCCLAVELVAGDGRHLGDPRPRRRGTFCLNRLPAACLLHGWRGKHYICQAP